MARRNPANPRYQKGAEVGKTRRSAASAKPKRPIGETAPAPSDDKKKERPKLLAPVPDDPEYKRWRNIWMGLLGAGIVLSGLAWWQQASRFGSIALALAYGCIFTALYIDFAKLRGMRKAAIEAGKAQGAGKKGATKTSGKKSSTTGS